jgi:hypothetical protein
MSCQVPASPTYQAVGTITIERVNDCTYTFSGSTKIWHCPSVLWNLTIGSATAPVGGSGSETSTATQIANDVAYDINYFTATNSIVSAIANPPNAPGTVEVLAKSVYTDPSQVDLYGWALSGSGQCSPQKPVPPNPPTCLYSVTLSPTLTMGMRPPL